MAHCIWRTDKSKPGRVFKWCTSHLLFWITHITHVFIIGGVELKHTADAREDNSLWFWQKKVKSLWNVTPPSTDGQSLQKSQFSWRAFRHTCAFLDGGSTRALPGDCWEGRSPRAPTGRALPPPSPPACPPSPPEQHKARQAAVPFTWHCPVARALVWGLTADTWPPLRRGGTNSLKGFSFSMASEKSASPRTSASWRAR